MKIVLIGSGNVAYHLAKAFAENSSYQLELFARNEEELLKISKELEIPFAKELPQDADLYIISVSDGAIEDLSLKITNPNALVTHTSGSISRENLKGNYRKGVFYPLQTFSKKKELNYSEIPFFVDAENDSDLQILSSVASKLSKRVLPADDEKRKYIHLTAVFACNFVNHLYARAKEISDSQHIPFDYFVPLIQETTDKIQYLDPKDAQTGPAIRNDKKVLELHESLIKDAEQLKLYSTLNESIKKMYNLD